MSLGPASVLVRLSERGLEESLSLPSHKRRTPEAGALPSQDGLGAVLASSSVFDQVVNVHAGAGTTSPVTVSGPAGVARGPGLVSRCAPPPPPPVYFPRPSLFGCVRLLGGFSCEPPHEDSFRMPDEYRFFCI